MGEMSMLLKVDKSGRLFMLDIKMKNGEVIIPSMEWEEAVNYTLTLTIVNDTYSDLMRQLERMN